MPSLKELRARIAGVKSQRKITSAMKMVAASKLRRFQARAEASRPYAEGMRKMVANAAAMMPEAEQPRLMRGGDGPNHLILLFTSDLGLAGGFNANVVRLVRQVVDTAEAQGERVQLMLLGRKGLDAMMRLYPEKVREGVPGTAGKEVPFTTAQSLGKRVSFLVETGEVDKISLVYNTFVNAMTQTARLHKIVPLDAPVAQDVEALASSEVDQALYEYEPGEGALLRRLLPRNLQVQLYAALLESAAGEQGARMTAMDNASRNAGKAIDRLSQHYNRSRQANITSELIEIISGAEAV